MNRDEQSHLIAQRSALQSMLRDILEGDVLDRAGLDDRVKEIDARLANVPPDARLPAVSELTVRGMFQGVLPKHRSFEFMVQPEGSIITGIVGTAIADPNVLNQHLHTPVTIHLTATGIGTGRPCYVLNLEPTW